MNRKKLIKPLLIIIFFILVINFLANKFYWYSGIWWFDMAMHFLGGFWLSLFCLYVFPFENFSFKSIFRVLVFVLCIGLGWEIFEIVVSKTITKDSFNHLDTYSDILFDLSGGTLALSYMCKRIMFTGETKVQSQ